MRKIIFVFPQWTDSYGLFAHFGRKAASLPPFNLAIMAAFALQAGYDAKIFDGEINRWDNDELTKRILLENPDIVAFGGMSPFFHRSVDCIHRLREKGYRGYIFVGGPHITIVQNEGFTDDMDIAFIGNSIKSFPAVLEYIQNHGNVNPEFLSSVIGLIYRDSAEIRNTGVELYGSTLDDRPMPARQLLENDRYTIGTFKGRKKCTFIQTIRGCPWECIYCCSKELQTRKISRRSPKLVVDEIEECVEKYGITHFFFVDDELTQNFSHITQICNEILARNLKITFEGSTRADLINEDLAKLLVKAGLIRISFGLESADLNVRKIIKKKVPLEAHDTANALFNSLGVETCDSTMLGLPGDTRETILHTIEYVANNRFIKQANFAITTPYPGTELYNMALNGDYGLSLTTKDYSKYRRYGSSVMKSDSLSPEDLLKLQNYGFARIYSKPWRWRTVFKKYGTIGILLQIYRYIGSRAWRVQK